MALIPCPECQKEVSTEAVACPQCALPHPGRQEQENGYHTGSLRTCPDCKKVISKRAQTCPSCGAPVPTEDLVQDTLATPLVEETWLCPHCSKPFTRKAKGKLPLDERDSMPSHEEKYLHAQSRKGLGYGHEGTTGRGDGPTLDQFLTGGGRRKNKSPLWGEAKESSHEPPRYPRASKKWTTLSVIFVLALLSVGAWAVLEFQDINGLEALVFWNMYM